MNIPDMGQEGMTQTQEEEELTQEDQDEDKAPTETEIEKTDYASIDQMRMAEAKEKFHLGKR